MAERILYIVTEDWFFASHFLPMVRAAQGLGLEPVVATRTSAAAAKLTAAGVRVVPVEAERHGIAPLRALAQARRLAAAIADERPAIVHLIALRSVVVGGRAARAAGVRRIVAAPTGLGHLWIDRTPMTALGRSVVRRSVRRLRGAGTTFLFENDEDPAALGLDPARGDRIALIGGAGVDPADFPPLPEPPSPPFRLALVARMLRSKGVADAVAAVRLLRAEGLAVELRLVGAPDPTNPATIAPEELAAWAAEPGIRWEGAVGDVAAVWRDSHVAILPSQREGLPRSLVEAMASGRPVIATDVPGCRRLVRHGVDGLLVPAGDAVALADAIRRLAGEPALRAAMAAAAQDRATTEFSAATVTRQIAAVYEALLSEGGRG